MSRDGGSAWQLMVVHHAVWQNITVVLKGHDDCTHLKDLKQKYKTTQRRDRLVTLAVIRLMLLWTEGRQTLWDQNTALYAGCILTQLFFFFFLASWSFRLPMLDILVRLLRLEMLSHEFWRRMRTSGEQERLTWKGANVQRCRRETEWSCG